MTLSAAGKREGGRKRNGWTPLNRSLQETVWDTALLSRVGRGFLSSLIV